MSNIELFQINIFVNFVYFVYFVKYSKLFKIQGTGCYDINVTFISSPKLDLLEFVKFEFRHVSSFSCIWKRDDNVFGKNTMTFWHNFTYMVNSFVFHYIWQLCLIAYRNYSKFCKKKSKRQHYGYCVYNDISMIYFNSNMTLPRVRKH